MLTVTTAYPIRIGFSKAMQDRMWRAFLTSGSTHSSRATTLPFLMNRCEERGVAYTLTAIPGLGYNLKPLPPADDPRTVTQEN